MTSSKDLAEQAEKLRLRRSVTSHGTQLETGEMELEPLPLRRQTCAPAVALTLLERPERELLAVQDRRGPHTGDQAFSSALGPWEATGPAGGSELTRGISAGLRSAPARSFPYTPAQRVLHWGLRG